MADVTNCAFCFMERTDPRLSKEHLISRPVAEAFGIDRSSSFGRLDPESGAIVWTSLDDLAVRLVCAPCNHGWMNDLEHGMAGIASWVREGDRGLTAQDVGTLRRWALKTHIVAAAIEGGTRRFGDDETESRVIPEATRARALYEGDESAHEAVVYAVARAANPEGFAYMFGNPTVEPEGPGYAGLASTSATFLVLGPLLLWVVTPFALLVEEVRGPPELSVVAEGLTFADLLVPTSIDTDPLAAIVVRNGDAKELFRVIEHLSERPTDD